MNPTVESVTERIRERSKVLADLEKEGAIKIVGAIYSLQDGSVTLLEEKKSDS